jgi:hypothetical protein
MAGDSNGPALNQGVLIYQGAPLSCVVPISNPDGSRPDLSQATAAWWAGAKPAGRPGSVPATVANAPNAVTKPLPILSDGAGGYQAILLIEPTDVSTFSPVGAYQHEIWLTRPGFEAVPVMIGPLVLRGTVGSAGYPAP